MQSKAATVEQYLAELSPDRREAIQEVRATIRANLDPGIQEGIGYGMIYYSIPHSIYPAGYHCDPKLPLGYAALASQKNYMALYVNMVYWEETPQDQNAHFQWFRQAWAKTGKKLDMGKCCIRFKRVEDLPLDVIGEAIRRVPMDKYIKYYTSVLAEREGGAKKAKKTGKAKTKVRTKASKKVASR